MSSFACEKCGTLRLRHYQIDNLMTVLKLARNDHGRAHAD